MNNEEKARAIIGEDCKKENCLQCGGRYSAENGGCAQYQKIMQMAQWKDEQIKQLIHYADKMYEYAFNLGPVRQGETLRNAMEEYKNFKFKEIYK